MLVKVVLFVVLFLLVLLLVAFLYGLVLLVKYELDGRPDITGKFK